MESDTLGYKSLEIPASSLIISVILHIVIVSSYFVWAYLGGAFDIRIFPKTKIEIPNAIVTESFIQVDVVALPDIVGNNSEFIDPTSPAIDAKKAAEAKRKKIALEAKKVAAKKKAEAMRLRKKKETAKKAKKKKEVEAAKKRKKDRAKAMADLEKQMERDRALKELEKSAKQRVKIKGNITSQGTSTKGAIGTPKDLYASLVKAAIENYFEVFPWQLNKDLEAIVSIQIAPTGRIKKKKLLKGSGDRTFDLGLLKAIAKAEPFRVPEDISILDQEIVLVFRPEDK